MTSNKTTREISLMKLTTTTVFRRGGFGCEFRSRNGAGPNCSCIKGGWWLKEVPAGVRSGQKEEEAPNWQGQEELAEEEFSESYAVGCVLENLPIKLSMKSTLNINVLVRAGAFWGLCRGAESYIAGGRAETVCVYKGPVPPTRLLWMARQNLGSLASLFQGSTLLPPSWPFRHGCVRPQPCVFTG